MGVVMGAAIDRRGASTVSDAPTHAQFSGNA